MDRQEVRSKESQKEGLSQFKRENTEPRDILLNASLRQLTTVDDWQWRDKASFLHKWADLFNYYFFDGVLPQPVISFERTRRGCLGHFVPGRNAYGLQFNINLNESYLSRSEAELLATLVHEQIHLWQDITGTAAEPPYHNKQFIRKASSIGLQVDPRRGYHIGPPTDPFVALLREFRVTVEPREPEIVLASSESQQRRRRLRRWSCTCKSVWCGGSLNCKCLDCGERLELNPT